MRPTTALRLARPATAAERGRLLLVAGSTAVVGALLIAATHILRLPAPEPPPGKLTGRVILWSPPDNDLAKYVTESGLRPGVVIGMLLLAVPVLALTVQALRVGSVARDRRMASLRLAGATPQDVRAVARAEAGGAAAAGALLAAPAYLILWLLAGVLPPEGARMLDTPDALDPVAWAALVPLAALAGALSGAAIHRHAVVEPLGVRRRSRPPGPGRASLVVLIVGLALVLAAIAGFPLVAGNDAAGPGPLLAMIGLLLAAFAGGPRLVLGCARVLARQRGAEALLASRRLRADPRSAGRVAAVLLVCGVALSVEALLLAKGPPFDGFNAAFYLTGFGMATLVVLIAAGVALLTLLVGAADGLLDARRPLAALAALGVDEPMLVRVLARQLSATAVPAIVAGALIGGPAISLWAAALDVDHPLLGSPVTPLLVACVTALAAGLVLAAAARRAAQLLRPLIRAAADPENLRVA